MPTIFILQGTWKVQDVYISHMLFFFSWLFQDCRRSGVSGEMDYLSAWIVSLSALPFLCLIWGKRIKCHHGAIITLTVAFSSPIHVLAIQLSSGNLEFIEALIEFSLQHNSYCMFTCIPLSIWLLKSHSFTVMYVLQM